MDLSSVGSVFFFGRQGNEQETDGDFKVCHRHGTTCLKTKEKLAKEVNSSEK